MKMISVSGVDYNEFLLDGFSFEEYEQKWFEAGKGLSVFV